MDELSFQLTAFEHEALSVGDSAESILSVRDAETLALIGAERRGFCTRGHRSVRLAQYVGLVRLGDRVLEILPKIGATADSGACRGTLLRLLRLAYDLPPFVRGEAFHDLGRGTLLDIFVSVYMDSVLDVVRTGLLRRYLVEEDDLGVVRGRILLQRQMTALCMRSDVVACRFDELSVDNPRNQILKAALEAVRPWSKNLVSGRKWLEANAALDEVACARDPLALLRELTSDRQSKHYEIALRWAEWILRLLSPNLRAGRNRAGELLFDMNMVFEKAVAASLVRRARDTNLCVRMQDRQHHLATIDAGSYFNVRPDIVISDGRQTVAVGDTKWAELSVDRTGRLVPDDAHVYQLNAYASVYRCEEFALIYPWHSGLSDSRMTTYHLRSPGTDAKRLHLLCVDVSEDGLPLRRVPVETCFSRL